MEILTPDILKRSVAGEAVAIRSVTRLEAAGGSGSKIFPPTYATERANLKYALEDRRINGEVVTTVLLDSVASQANRMEEALLEAWEAGLIDFPVISVDFGAEEGIEDLGRITTLQAPHRIADALLRDSVSDGRRFRDTAVGQAYSEANVRNATAVYMYCPTALVFGVWDSTGPRGGLGHKFQRALVSEIVGFGAQPGVKVASRIDPAGIQKNVKIFHSATDESDWTPDPEEAATDRSGKPRDFTRKGVEGREKGTPSAINHGNIPPSIDEYAGGVTIDYALQSTVLSLAALRRLRFRHTIDGQMFDPALRPKVENAARTALAALALAAIAFQRRQGYDLRSRCLLEPKPGGPLVLEMIPTDGVPEGETTAKYTLDQESAASLLKEASAEAAEFGLAWEREPLTLTPSPKLASLIRESRKLATDGVDDQVDEG